LVLFSDLGIGPDLVSALEKQGIIEPFEVQRESIPDSILGHDVCCRAPTGSGKTLAFGLPLLARTQMADKKRPTSLILTPTRELAEQICTVLKPLAKSIGFNVLSVYGGVSYRNQLRGLEDGVEILVACPGRLLDLIERRALSLKNVDIIVLDEADRMADMGFMEPVCEIIEMCSENRQTILFSATLDEDVIDIVKTYQTDPVTIEVGPEEVSIESMEHYFWKVKNHKRVEVTAEIVRKSGRSIIFCRTRLGVNRLEEELRGEGISCTPLHGGLNQNQRDRAMRKFSTSRTMVLIATDVASRGIDVEGVNCVINYDPPENGKAYKHRGGRTARAGTNGVVISYVPKAKERIYSRIQKEVGVKNRYTLPQIELLEENEFELIPPERGDRSERKGRGQSGRNRNRISKNKRKFPTSDRQKERPSKRRNNPNRSKKNEQGGRKINSKSKKGFQSPKQKRERGESPSRPRNRRKKSNYRS
jgi:superfamily II DNA/RNA helicase